MAEDCRDITVHAASFDPRGGPVFYASLPYSAESFKGYRRNGPGDKHRLASILWDHLAGMENPLWKSFHSTNGDDFPVRVVRGPLGRPQLLLGECLGPAISFSEYGGNLWAALCGDRSDIGIDAAGADEFQGEYPFHRVFNDHELQHALSLAGGELGNASALLWSVKEAVVKALGCAFHLVDPLQINIYPSVAGEEGGYAFPVRLSGKALMRFPTGAEPIGVRSLPHRKMWLSIALLNRQS
ncbi:MAG: 4'-phosphopantetheinyl transferase superfamily protein [Syntrophobacteraceae bacterium]